jgi:hypothetical protein
MDADELQALHTLTRHQSQTLAPEQLASILQKWDAADASSTGATQRGDEVQVESVQGSVVADIARPAVENLKKTLLNLHLDPDLDPQITASALRFFSLQRPNLPSSEEGPAPVKPEEEPERSEKPEKLEKSEEKPDSVSAGKLEQEDDDGDAAMGQTAPPEVIAESLSAPPPPAGDVADSSAGLDADGDVEMAGEGVEGVQDDTTGVVFAPTASGAAAPAVAVAVETPVPAVAEEEAIPVPPEEEKEKPEEENASLYQNATISGEAVSRIESGARLAQEYSVQLSAAKHVNFPTGRKLYVDPNTGTIQAISAPRTNVFVSEGMKKNACFLCFVFLCVCGGEETTFSSLLLTPPPFF